MVLGLPYRQIWVLDFEYGSESGAHPVVRCMVARELNSHKLIRMFEGEFGPVPPFPLGDDVLFVAYNAVAELSCFLVLGWPFPKHVLDLYVEFLRLTNKIHLPAGRGLLGAMIYHHIPGITKEEKDEGRALAIRGGPYTSAEREALLEYCRGDVDERTVPLLERMLPHIRSHPHGLAQAELRGRYMGAVARVEHCGIPIDVATLERLRERWDEIKVKVVAEVNHTYGVYEGLRFRSGLFAGYLRDQGIRWPRLISGELDLADVTFRDMAKRYPQLEPLRQVRSTMSKLRVVHTLAVGPDNRNRTSLMPFWAKTSRNQPKSGQYIFGPSSWMRGLIKPEPGKALSYLDYSGQEIAIGAALSGDRALLAAVETGDPHMFFAKAAGLAPADATKATHGPVRELSKTCFHGVNYGMQPPNLALRMGVTEIEARELMRRLGELFPVFVEWAEANVHAGQLRGYLSTVFGWTLTTDGERPNTLRNFVVQANAAEMLRLACCLTTEHGIAVCGPLHDALLIEAGVDEIGDVVAAARADMAAASRSVLDGLEIGVDAEIVHYPDRYMDDKRGRATWDLVMGLLGGREGGRVGGREGGGTPGRVGG